MRGTRSDLRSLRESFDFSALPRIRSSPDGGNAAAVRLRPVLRELVLRAAGGLGALPESVEDLAQEAFLLVWRDVHQVHGKDGRSVFAWVCSVVRNVVFHRVKHERQARGVEVDYPGTHHLTLPADAIVREDAAEDRIPSFDDDPIAEAAEHEESEVFARGLGQLKRRQQVAFMLYLEGETYAEIGSRQGISRWQASRDVERGRALCAQIRSRLQH